MMFSYFKGFAAQELLCRLPEGEQVDSAESGPSECCEPGQPGALHRLRWPRGGQWRQRQFILKGFNLTYLKQLKILRCQVYRTLIKL